MQRLVAEGAHSIALCTLFSVVNPVHEIKLRDRIKAGADEAHMVGFVDAMASGANLARTNPILVCREGLKDRYYGGEQRGDRERRLHEMAAIIKAWNAWRWGDQIRSKAALSLKSLSDFPAVRP